jgi:hypothetical protein
MTPDELTGAAGGIAHLLEHQPAAYYREAAARARRLHAEATTPRLKQYLGEVIARCEQLAREVESASEKH